MMKYLGAPNDNWMYAQPAAAPIRLHPEVAPSRGARHGAPCFATEWV